MGTLIDKLNATNASKEQIRQAIERKKVSVPENTPLKDYPAKIDGIYPDALFLREQKQSVTIPSDIHEKYPVIIKIQYWHNNWILIGLNKSGERVVATYSNGAWYNRITMSNAEGRVDWFDFAFTFNEVLVSDMNSGVLLISKDYGLSWDNVSILDANPKEIVRLGEGRSSEFLVCTSNNTLYLSENEGSSWRKIESSKLSAYRDVFCVNDYYYGQNDNNQTFRTKDFVSFESVAFNTSVGKITSMEYVDGIYILGDANNWGCFFSLDGVDFTFVNTNEFYFRSGIYAYSCYSGYVVFGAVSSKTVLNGSDIASAKSNDLKNFTLTRKKLPKETSNFWGAKSFDKNNDFLIFIGYSTSSSSVGVTNLFISYDGMTWTDTSIEKAVSLRDAMDSDKTRMVLRSLVENKVVSEGIPIDTLQAAYEAGVNSI